MKTPSVLPFLLTSTIQHDPCNCNTSGAERDTHTHHRDRTCISHRGARAIAMRVLNDTRPTVAPDASSAPPLLITPTAAGMVGVVQLQPDTAGGSDAGFDADMVVILAALLCVLVCALGVNSLVHHFVLNCGRTVAAPAPPHAAAAAAPATDSDSTGLKKRELRRIPVVLYEANKQPSASSATDDDDDCAICLGEFDDGEELRLLPGCHHGFHVQCIDVWLVMHASCPTCRNSLLVQQDRHAGAGAGDGEAATVAGEEA